jgi:hypothetical protein
MHPSSAWHSCQWFSILTQILGSIVKF